MGRGSAWREASRWGETPQASFPFVLPSVLRAVPGEGRRDGRRGSCLGFVPLGAATHGPCPPTPCGDIHYPFHPILPSMKELFTGAVSTPETTWFLHSGRDPNSQTSFQLEGNTTHELGTPSVSLAIAVCLCFGKKSTNQPLVCVFIYMYFIYIYIKI